MANSQKQCIIVMRHGARLDSANPNWELTEGRERPYDTPLTDRGKVEVHEIACKRFKDMSISKVISSPFLRCLQTAQEVCKAIDSPGIITNNTICEVLTPGAKMTEAPKVPAEDLSFFAINIVQFGSDPMPDYPEELSDARKRYLASIPHIADQYYPENLLIVTHQNGVEQAITLALGSEALYEASYCGYVVLTRSSKNGHWKLESKFRVDKYDN